MTPRLNAALLAALLLVGLPTYWFLLDSGPHGASPKPVALARLRLLAQAGPDERPIAIRAEQIGRRHVVGDFLAAGSGLLPVPYTIWAYEIVYADGSVVTVDRGMNRAASERQGIEDHDPFAQARVEHADRTARAWVVLNLHPEHDGVRSVALSPGSPARRKILERGAPYRLTPGVVVVPTPGAAAGSRMLYVELKDGSRYLFGGDVVPMAVSWKQGKLPARAAMLFSGGDRAQSASFLNTVRAWKTADPQLRIVPGHDPQLPSGIGRGFLTAGAIRDVPK